MTDFSTGENVYFYRLSLGLGRREFGKLLGLSASNVWQMEYRTLTLPQHLTALHALEVADTPAALSEIEAAHAKIKEGTATLLRLARLNKNP